MLNWTLEFLNRKACNGRGLFLSKEPEDTSEQIEKPLKGMEMALVSIASAPIEVLNRQFKTDFISNRNQICIKLNDQKRYPIR